MMWLARLKPLAAVAAALILTTAGVVVLGRQQPAPERAREQAKTAAPATAGAGGTAVADVAADRALARRQLAVIDEAWDLMVPLAESARIEISTAPFGLWGRRRLEALHRAGAEKAEIVTALVKYMNSLKELEETAKARHDAARATSLGIYETQFLRMEAEIWLNEEKAR
jgi:hypothetical protein